MTTVGYGDVTMKSKAGKVFGVLWMLFGAISFSLLTGSLTTLIMNLHAPQDCDMMNQRVGVIKGRVFDTFVVSQGGGIVCFNENVDNFHADVFELLLKLEQGDIDGVMLDSYTLKYVTYRMILHRNNSVVRWDRVSGFFLHHTLRAEKTYEGQKLTYGMLIKELDDFEYFKDIIAESRLNIELTWNYHMNRLEEMHHGHSELHEHSNFHDAVVIISVVVVVVILLGALYEAKRRKDMKKSRHCCYEEDCHYVGPPKRRIESYLV